MAGDEQLIKIRECWIDMNVVGFYASEYWQVERCDGSTNGIKLRKSSTEDSEQLTTVPLCTKFQSSESRNGWAKFTYGGKTGWMKLHYATPCGSAKDSVLQRIRPHPQQKQKQQ